MKTQRNILFAFILNLFFSLFEFIGGLFTGSVAILSDAVHDIGDALGIGVSYFLEKKSGKHPDQTYTYGYLRYSVLGGLITSLILMIGSVSVIYHAVLRMINPTPIHYNGMIVFAVVGVIVNFAAAYFTREGDSLNQRAVNLHMLEDVLGWAVVLVGAVIMRFTDFALLDSILSMGVAFFILFHTVKNLKTVLDIFLEKSPESVDMELLKEEILAIQGVMDVHHIHIRSLDGYRHESTMHVVTAEDDCEVKHQIGHLLEKHNIVHVVIQTETPDEECHDKHCHIGECHGHHGHHHHHH